jgi:hypothetical protein
VLGSVIFWYGGWVFLTSAIGEIRSRAPGMMTLVTLAITTAYAYSLAITFGIVQGMDFYWELATLVTIMLLGHWMEMRAVGSAQSALNELAKLLPDTAERIVDEQTEVVARACSHNCIVVVRMALRGGKISLPAPQCVQGRMTRLILRPHASAPYWVNTSPVLSQMLSCNRGRRSSRSCPRTLLSQQPAVRPLPFHRPGLGPYLAPPSLLLLIVLGLRLQ